MRAIPPNWDPMPNDGEANSVILAWLALGDYDRALDLLERRAPTNKGSTWSVARDPLSDPIRYNPRFQRVLEIVWPH